MIRIALLDDENDQREITAALLERYLSQHPELSAQVRSFQSGYELLDAVERSGSFDLYLLDIVMPEQNGIEVGRSGPHRLSDHLTGLRGGFLSYQRLSLSLEAGALGTDGLRAGPGHGHPGPASGAGRHGADQGRSPPGAA